jgi:hypothetical protein
MPIHIPETEVRVWLLTALDGRTAPLGGGDTQHMDLGTEVDDRAAPHGNGDTRCADLGTEEDNARLLFTLVMAVRDARIWG